MRASARVALDVAERRIRSPSTAVAVHAGAQSTADTAALAAHAAEIGADAVAVIAPPYFALDEVSQLEHFAAAAAACAPLPFYVYEFAITSGYAVPPAVVARLREQGVLAAGISKTTVRLVTHLDVDDAGIDRAIAAIRAIASG